MFSPKNLARKGLSVHTGADGDSIIHWFIKRQPWFLLALHMKYIKRMYLSAKLFIEFYQAFLSNLVNVNSNDAVAEPPGPPFTNMV